MGSIDFAKLCLSFALVRQEIFSFIKKDLWKSLCTKVFIPLWQGTLAHRNVVVLSGAAALTTLFIIKRQGKTPDQRNHESGERVVVTNQAHPDASLVVDTENARQSTPPIRRDNESAEPVPAPDQQHPAAAPLAVVDAEITPQPTPPIRRDSESSTISNADDSPQLINQEDAERRSPHPLLAAFPHPFLAAFPLANDSEPQDSRDLVRQEEFPSTPDNSPTDGTGSTSTDPLLSGDASQAADENSDRLTASPFIDDTQISTTEMVAAGLAAIKVADQVFSSPPAAPSDQESRQQIKNARILTASAAAIVFAFMRARL